MPYLSIIIPVYNAEKYIKTCLDSILNQSFKNFEVIIVNDASPDNTLLILNDYAKKDNRINIFSHEINQGVAGARNSGLKIAKGNYVAFVDQDDWLEKDMYQTLISIAESESADIVECNYEENGASGLDKMPVNLSIGKSEANEYITLLYQNRLSLALWNKVYNLKKIRDSGIYFADHKLVEAEDLLFNLQVINIIDLIKVIDKNYYHHTKHTESLSFHKINNYFEKTENLINRYKSYIENNSNFEKLFYAFSLIIIIKLRGILFQSIIQDRNHIHSGAIGLKRAAKDNLIREGIYNALKNKKTKFSDRIISILFCFKLYAFLSFIYYMTIKFRGDTRLSDN